MTKKTLLNQTCVVIGASHAGVNLAFALRRKGWKGKIILFDRDPEFPYHRPPLSKTYLISEPDTQRDVLLPKQNYEADNVSLKLGIKVIAINRNEKNIALSDGSIQHYDKLVIATGARPYIPSIKGLDKAKNIFTIRTAQDAINIKEALKVSVNKQVIIIGGGYVGLEAAASLKKIGAEVTVLEREARILSRVTAPEMSIFFKALHNKHKVSILTNKNVVTVNFNKFTNEIICEDKTAYKADIIIVGVGVMVNTELAQQAGLDIVNGIKVDTSAKTNDKDIYAIGDCTYHYNPHYKRFIRLESVQNAIDQAKVAAAAICGEAVTYNTLPWFWSDQYDVKLQMVGLSEGYNQTIKRVEREKGHCESIWYFKDDVLIAVDAVNNAKAYILGKRFIINNQKIDKLKLANTSIPLKPLSFI